MSELVVEVCEVLDVKPHPNADRLELIQVKGWDVVVQKDLLKVGDPVVYFPPDSVLTEDLADRLGIRKYLVPVKRDGSVTGRGPSGAGDCYTGLHQRQDRNPDGDIMNQATGGKPAHMDEGRSRAYGQKMRSTTRMRAMGPTSDDDPGGRDDARWDAGADGLTFRQDGVEHIVRITVRRLAE